MREGETGSMGLTDAHQHIKIEQIVEKNLLYSTGNYIQYLVINYNVKESKTYIYQLNHFAVHQKHVTL